MLERKVPPIERLALGVAPKAIPVMGENGGFSVSPSFDNPVTFPYSPIIDSVGTIFDVSKFAVPRKPLVVGTVNLDLPEDTTVSDMVIKMPGVGYRVPEELSGLLPFLEASVTAEKVINPDADDYYAYLTAQRTRVKQGEIKRSPGAHSDSVQGQRIQPKVAIEHGFTAVNMAPTRWFTHGFDLTGLDPDTHWLNVAFEEQKKNDEAVQFAPGEIVLFDAYNVHEPIEAEEDGDRTFVRLIYSRRIFDRVGNTRNTLFDYDWNFQPRPVPSDLIGMP